MYQKRSPEQWQQLIEQQASSGQTQAVFCEAQGIAYSTFQRWKKRLRTETHEAAPSSVDTLFAPLLDSDGVTPDGGWTIELDLGDGICLRMRRDG